MMYSSVHVDGRPRLKGQGGFTLIELLVTVIIVAILAAIALPAYQDQVRKARRADAYDGLLHVQNLQEKWRASNSTYSNSLADLGFGDAVSRQGYYTLTVEGGNATDFTVRAVATDKGGQSGDAGCTAIVLVVDTGSPRGSRTPSDCW